MNILDALDALNAEEEPTECDTLINGMKPIHNEVFKVALLKLGIDPAEYMGEPIEDRNFILDYYEHRAKETNAAFLAEKGKSAGQKQGNHCFKDN